MGVAAERGIAMDDRPEGSGVKSIRMTVPLFIRLLEYAREDAKSDIDLHNVAERACEKTEVLDMDEYGYLVGSKAKFPRIAKDYVS